MKIAISEAKAQLAELVRRAEAGDEVILTRHGQNAVQLIALTTKPTSEEKLVLIEKLQARARDKVRPGPCAARSQDFLYDENGLPK